MMDSKIQKHGHSPQNFNFIAAFQEGFPGLRVAGAQTARHGAWLLSPKRLSEGQKPKGLDHAPLFSRLCDC